MNLASQAHPYKFELLLLHGSGFHPGLTSSDYFAKQLNIAICIAIRSNSQPKETEALETLRCPSFVKASRFAYRPVYTKTYRDQDLLADDLNPRGCPKLIGHFFRSYSSLVLLLSRYFCGC